MFTIELVPAQQGDALWIEYGTRTNPRRILIDGGTPPTIDSLSARITRLPAPERNFELLIVTHIDTDHIGGILRLLNNPPADLTFSDVWFNGWPQIDPLTDEPTLGPATDMTAEAILGPIDGEILDRLLDLHVGDVAKAHNGAFSGEAAMIPARGPLPTIPLEGGMRLTILAPDRGRLRKLRARWASVVRDAARSEADVEAIVAAGARRRGLEPLLGPVAPDIRASSEATFTSDRTPANGSSIVVLAEFEGKSALFTGDGFAPVIEIGLKRLLAERGIDRLPVDVVKLAHHGSRNNTSLPMLGLLDCRRFLVSTSGAIFCHPDIEAISRVIVTNGPDVELGFNYRTDTTNVWDDPVLQGDFAFPFTTQYPKSNTAGLRVVL
jgi:glyoxylase-like metal-dependent hydrolase (beta-lactamase superfamily II)